jgi:hypothetical protein
MKKLTLSFTLLLTTTIFAQVPYYVPTNGLVGWWPFNGNANDESGNGNNGAVNGPTLTTDRNGVANKAYNFDGVNDYISTLRNYQSSFTASIWFKTNVNPEFNPLIDAFNSNWEVQLINSAPSYVSFITSSNLQIFSSPQIISDNNWNNIIFTLSSNSLKIFLNGNLIGQFSVNPLPNNSGDYNFGASLSGSAQYFNGKLDDIGIWNRALTDIEIATLFEGCNLSIASQPQDQNVPTSIGTANFLVSTSSSNASYQWQTNLGLGFQNLSNAGQYSGVTSSTLSVSNLSMTNNNQVFRCLINDAGCTDTTTIATLTIIDDASILETDFPLISISPNPTAGDFTIAGLELYNNISTMRVSDVNGKLVKELDPTASKFTLGTVKSGVYFLTITAGDKQEVIKIIKE